MQHYTTAGAQSQVDFVSSQNKEKHLPRWQVLILGDTLIHKNKSYYKEVNQSRFVLSLLYHGSWLFVNRFHRKLTYCLQQTVFSKHFVQCENTRKTPITGTDVSHRKEWWENQIDSFHLILFCEKSTRLIADALHAWKRWYMNWNGWDRKQADCNTKLVDVTPDHRLPLWIS